MGAMTQFRRLARPFPASRYVTFVSEHPKMNVSEITSHTDTFLKWEAEDKHFTLYEADRRAINLGFHPCEIWGWDEWVEACLKR